MTDQGASGPYRVESGKVLPKEVQGLMDVRIWNVKEFRGITRRKELRAQVVPAIAINGEVVFPVWDSPT